MPLGHSKKVVLLNPTDPPSYQKSFFLTDLAFTLPLCILIINDTLILSGLGAKADTKAGRWKYVGVEFIDLTSGKIYKRAQIFDLDSLRNSTVNIHVFVFHASYTGENSVLVNHPASPNVWEYSLAGELIHTYTEVPPNYIPPPPWDNNWDPRDRQKYWQWCDAFTASSPPFPFRQSSFFVVRAGTTALSLDFYDLENKKFIDSILSEDIAFFGTDGEYIYLINRYDDKFLYIYKYGIRDERIH